MYKNMRLVFKWIIYKIFWLLQVSSVFCNGVNENQVLCETYYENSESLNCLTHYGRNFSTDFMILDTVCKNSSSLNNSTIPEINSTKFELHFINCSLKPEVFQNFYVPLISKFTLGPNDRNPVLKNGTFIGLCSLRGIFAQGNSIEIIEPEAFKCLKSLNALYLSKNKLDFIPLDTFKEMPLLSNLFLDENNLSTFIEGTFDNLVSLRTLYLHKNSIDYLQDAVFKTLKNLTILKLNNNSLKVLNKPYLCNLTKLRNLDLSYNKIKEFSNLFSNNTELTSLHLSGNEGINITNNSFCGLPNLYLLYLEKCEIESLPIDTFSNTPSVKILNLSANKLKIVNSELFSNLRKLVQLDLSFNNIAELQNEPFKNNKKLASLTLRGNNISEIKSNVFKGLFSLGHLDLSLNKLEKLENYLSGLITLRSLNISHNFIKHFEDLSLFQNSLSSLVDLKDLDISNNKINELYGVFFNNKRIKTLDISNNPHLVLSNDSFRGLSKLKILNINYCSITSITRNIFLNTPKLSTVLVRGNKLKEIDSGMFYELKELYLLDVSRNDIYSLTDQPFKGNRRLRSLLIHENRIREIQNGDFIGLSTLRHLDISKNFIERIESNSFEPLSELDILNISQNSITSLSAITTHLVDIIEIDVSYNKLNDFRDKNWQQFKHLKIIKASNNFIEHLYLSNIPSGTIHLERNDIKIIYVNTENEKKFSHFLSFSEVNEEAKSQIYLSGNPLKCDCQFYEFYKSLKKEISFKNIHFVDELICQYPDELRGKTLQNLMASHFVCNVNDSCPQSCICKYRAYDSINIMNCNNADYEHLPLEAPYNTNVLYIKRSKLTSLLHLSDMIWENLTEIHADGNKVIDEEFYIPKKLKYLGLSNNKLSRLPHNLEEYTKTVKDFNLTLSGNLWPCDCSIVPFKTFLSEHISQITDISELRCIFSNDSESTIILKDMKYSDLCSFTEYVEAIILLSSMGSITVIVSIAFLIFYYKNKNHILAYLYTHANTFYMLCGCDNPRSEDKLFDCFISYSSTDREIALRIVEELEDPNTCKFCIHERNWISGKFITTNIIESIENSRKTLILLSETFLKSEWFHLEFQAAYHQTLKDKKDRLILVVVGDLPDKNEMEKDLQYVISTKTYLQWGERWFWEKIRYSIYEENNFLVREKRNVFQNISCCSWKKRSETQEFELEEDVRV